MSARKDPGPDNLDRVDEQTDRPVGCLTMLPGPLAASVRPFLTASASGPKGKSGRHRIEIRAGPASH